MYHEAMQISVWPLFYDDMQNIGKKFEQAIKESVPDYALLYRLPDPAQSFGGGSATRFSRHNPFDFILWDSKRHVLYALEAKTVSGKSISFERNKGDSGVIHHFQSAGLNNWNEFDGTVCGFIIEFRALEKTIFLDIESYNWLIGQIDKKSFNIGDLDENGLSYFVIPQTKKRTRYVYDIDSFLSREEKENKNGK